MLFLESCFVPTPLINTPRFVIDVGEWLLPFFNFIYIYFYYLPSPLLSRYVSSCNPRSLSLSPSHVRAEHMASASPSTSPRAHPLRSALRRYTAESVFMQQVHRRSVTAVLIVATAILPSHFLGFDPLSDWTLIPPTPSVLVSSCVSLLSLMCRTLVNHRNWQQVAGAFLFVCLHQSVCACVRDVQTKPMKPYWSLSRRSWTMKHERDPLHAFMDSCGTFVLHPLVTLLKLTSTQSAGVIKADTPVRTYYYTWLIFTFFFNPLTEACWKRKEKGGMDEKWGKMGEGCQGSNGCRSRGSVGWKCRKGGGDGWFKAPGWQTSTCISPYNVNKPCSSPKWDRLS